MLRRLLLGRRGITYALRPTPAATITSPGGGRGFCSDSSPSSSSHVTALFRRYDIDELDTEIVLCKFPDLLTLDLDGNIRPKLDFLRDCGLSGTDIGNIFVSNPFLMNESLSDSISPSVDFLKTIFPSKGSLIRVLKLKKMTLLARTRKNADFVGKNVDFLRDRGVPEARILSLFLQRRRVLEQNHEAFVDAVCQVESVGLSPASGVSYERSFNLSADTIRKTMDLSRKIGRKVESLLSHGSQLEKRIFPRCAVLNLLVSRGLLRRKDINWNELVVPTEPFFQRYVESHKNEVPDVVNAFRGDTEFQQSFECLKDDGVVDDDQEEEAEHPLTLLYREVLAQRNNKTQEIGGQETC